MAATISGTIQVRVVGGDDLIAMDKKTSDPFVVVSVPGTGMSFKTGKVKKTLAPRWEATDSSASGLLGPFANASTLDVEVFDWDRFSSPDGMGSVSIPLADLAEGNGVTAQFTLTPPNDSPKRNAAGGAGTITLEYTLQSSGGSSSEKKGKGMVMGEGEAPIHAVLPPIGGIEGGAGGVPFSVSVGTKTILCSAGLPDGFLDTLAALVRERTGVEEKEGSRGMLTYARTAVFAKNLRDDNLVPNFMAAVADAALMMGYRVANGLVHGIAMGLMLEPVMETSVAAPVHPSVVLRIHDENTIYASSALGAPQVIPVVAGALSVHGFTIKTDGGFKPKGKRGLYYADFKKTDFNSPKSAPQTLSNLMNAMSSIGLVLEAAVGVRTFVFRPYTRGLHPAVEESRSGQTKVVAVVEEEKVGLPGGLPMGFYATVSAALSSRIELQVAQQFAEAGKLSPKCMVLKVVKSKSGEERAKAFLSAHELLFHAMEVACGSRVVMGAGGAYAIMVGDALNPAPVYVQPKNFPAPMVRVTGVDNGISGLEFADAETREACTNNGFMVAENFMELMPSMNTMMATSGRSRKAARAQFTQISNMIDGAKSQIHFTTSVCGDGAEFLVIVPLLAQVLREYASNTLTPSSTAVVFPHFVAGYAYHEEWSYALAPQAGAPRQQVDRWRFHFLARMASGDGSPVTMGASTVAPPVAVTNFVPAAPGGAGARAGGVPSFSMTQPGSMTPIVAPPPSAAPAPSAPPAYEAPAPAPAYQAEAPLPAGWSQSVDPEGKTVYIFLPTNTMTYDRPSM